MHDSNCSVSVPSPALVDQAPSQSQTDLSVCNLCIGYGPEGETQEPGQAESATSSFLATLWSSGYRRVCSISDRIARESHSSAVHSVIARARAAQAEVPLSALKFCIRWEFG